MVFGRRMQWVLCCGLIAWSPFAGARESDSEGRDREDVLTVDHAVPHVSTVPANAGDLIKLFVRERVRRGDHDDGERQPREAALMIHGRTVPVLAAFELLPQTDYDWAFSLAKSGVDVFMLDFQGSGLSPRPTMSNPCNVRDEQRLPLIPNQRAGTCSQRGREASYPFVLNTEGSDLDELDTAVDYIRNLRRLDKVHLIAWAQGSFRAGAYAARNRDKVASLFLLAPIFNKEFRIDPPKDIPRPGTPMTLRTRAEQFRGDGLTSGWDVELKCPNQREPGIEDVVWGAILDSDDVGRQWGLPPAGSPAGSPPEGVMRIREVTLWGWNATIAKQLKVPTLIIQGEFDTGQGGVQQLEDLYAAIQGKNKLRFKVQCSGQFMNWDNRRQLLHRVSKEWIRGGTVAGFSQGEFFMDTEGNLSPL